MTTEPLTGKIPTNPKETAAMVLDCVGLSREPITGPELHAKATERGYLLTPEFAEKAAGWHRDYLRQRRAG